MILVEEWIKESREVRTKHLDPREDCIERGGNSTVHRGVLAQYLNTNFPSKIDLCHACGNDKCSNPKHLYWGSRSENVMDSIEHGTYDNPFTRLVEKYGEYKAREVAKKNSTKGSRLGGLNNRGKPKSEEHKQNLRNAWKTKALLDQ